LPKGPTGVLDVAQTHNLPITSETHYCTLFKFIITKVEVMQTNTKITVNKD